MERLDRIYTQWRAARELSEALVAPAVLQFSPSTRQKEYCEITCDIGLADFAG